LNAGVIIKKGRGITPLHSFEHACMQKHMDAKLPLSVTTGILKSWIFRFKEEYLMNQTFFEPYPEGLKDIDALTIYCDGEDYWKQ